MRALAVLGLLAIPFAAGADEVFLQGGGIVRGEVVAERADSLVIDVGPGRVTLPRSRVERVVLSNSDLGTYRQRAAVLAPQDARGWLALARWAAGHDLLTQAREAYARAAAADPTSAEAQQGLGRELVDGRWLSEDAANRARGLMEFQGRWMTPAERSAALEVQAADAAARRAETEAAVRIREAEARAEAAEAEARRMQAEAQQAGGIPVYGPYGPYGGGGFGPVIVTGSRHGSGRHHTRPSDPPPAPAPPPPPPPRDNGASRPTRAHGDTAALQRQH
jgi:hypothetical protein